MARPFLSRTTVLAALRSATDALTVPEISAATTLSQVQVRRALKALRAAGEVCYGDPARRGRCGRCHLQYVPCDVYAQRPGAAYATG